MAVNMSGINDYYTTSMIIEYEINRHTNKCKLTSPNCALLTNDK